LTGSEPIAFSEFVRDYAGVFGPAPLAAAAVWGFAAVLVAREILVWSARLL